ncbi:unnamed protein product, partial [Clonostachys rosea f. rosea IK726]
MEELAIFEDYDTGTRKVIERYSLNDADDIFFWLALFYQELADLKGTRNIYTLTKLKSFPSGTLADRLYPQR